MLLGGTHLRATLFVFLLLQLCTGCAPSPLYPLETSRPNIGALIHRQTEQEAKDAVIRTLAGTESKEHVRPALRKEPPGKRDESFRGQSLITVIGADEIAQIFIPYGPRGHTGHAGAGDLTTEDIETVLFKGPDRPL